MIRKAKISPHAKDQPWGLPVSTINSVNINIYIYTLGYFTFTLLHFCAISVSCLCFLVTTSYIIHHKKYQFSISCGSSGTGHRVFDVKLH